MTPQEKAARTRARNQDSRAKMASLERAHAKLAQMRKDGTAPPPARRRRA